MGGLQQKGAAMTPFLYLVIAVFVAFMATLGTIAVWSSRPNSKAAATATSARRASRGAPARANSAH